MMCLSYYHFTALLNGYFHSHWKLISDFIAAILTVMGYSMTDTVVVFDRIREYLNDGKQYTNSPK